MVAWILIVLAGLVIRLALLPAPGFPTDVGAFASWMHAIVQLGPHAMYIDQSNRLFPAVDYPPGYLYVLWALGLLEKLFFGPHPSELIDRIWIKLPAVLADFVIAFELAAIARRFGGRLAATRTLAILLLAPMLWLISALWGQVDVIAALGLVLALRAALAHRFYAMWILLALAISIKPQPIVTVPLFGLFQAFRERRALPLVLGPCMSFITAYLVALPAAPSPRPDQTLKWLFERYTFGVAKYPNGSSGAFNIYTIFGNAYEPDTVRIAGQPLHTLGTAVTILIIAGCAVALALRLRSISRSVPVRDASNEAAFALVASCTVAILGLFLGMTRMHERYEMGAIVLLPLLAVFGRSWAAAAMVLWADFCVNAIFILIGFYGGHHHPQIKLVVHAISLANVAAFGTIILLALRKKPQTPMARPLEPV